MGREPGWYQSTTISLHRAKNRTIIAYSTGVSAYFLTPVTCRQQTSLLGNKRELRRDRFTSNGTIVSATRFESDIADVPVLSTLFAGPPYGIGLLTAGVILAIMVLPLSPISRDVFEAVPPVLKEAAYGIGCSTWEVFRYVALPYTREGVIGAIMLALGRALGETMAVTFVIGNAHRFPGSLLAPGTTIAATIANEFTEAVGDLYYSALIALGLILFVITFIVLAIARYMLMRIERRVG